MGNTLGNFHSEPPLFMGLIKCFDVRRSDRLLLRIPEICVNIDLEKNTPERCSYCNVRMAHMVFGNPSMSFMVIRAGLFWVGER